MDVKKIILLVVALIVAAGSAFAIRALLSGGTSAPPVQAGPIAAVTSPAPAVGPRVLVASTTLPVGTIITPQHLTFQPWPRDMVQEAYFIDDTPLELEAEDDQPEAKTGKDAKTGNKKGAYKKGGKKGGKKKGGKKAQAAEAAPVVMGAPQEALLAEAIGKVVRISIGAGQPLSRQTLVGAGESGFLAAALNPGMRAVTVPIDNISGLAGFVFPGDRVDLLLLHSVGEGGETEADTRAKRMQVAETIARNVRVIAIDQRTDDTAGKPQQGRTVTFEVTPKMVEEVSVARMLGKIHLSLRAIADQRSALDAAIARGDLEVGDDMSSAEDLALEYAATALPEIGSSSFTTGGEVSRFALDNESRRSIQKARAQEQDLRAQVRVRMGRRPAETLRVGESTNGPTAAGLANAPAALLTALASGLQGATGAAPGAAPVPSPRRTADDFSDPTVLDDQGDFYADDAGDFYPGDTE
ncbi:MAG: Flp pilus assembly protein CpaB [Pacificimonas sp.]|jgi:pilus assembly protein CpaB|nr:Flp pilus assembly protein CpaB [Pacificimonas sp.]